MVDDPEAERLDTDQQSEEEEGGPVKSFLEHLEDLRWVLIKSGVAAGVAMLACLLGGNYVVRVLEWPLTRAPGAHTLDWKSRAAQHPLMTRTVRVLFGTNQLGVLQVATNDQL